MIKPSDLASLAPQLSPHLAAIEAHIDRSIKYHAAAGRPWPLVVPTARSNWSLADIDTVLNQYRSVGWSAMAGGHRALCVLSPIETATATANQADEALQRTLAEHSTTIAQPDPSPSTETMTVGTDDAKGMPPGLAEEIAAMDPADRVVAERIADMPLVDPSPGYEDRAVDRARREGVLPPTATRQS